MAMPYHGRGRPKAQAADAGEETNPVESRIEEILATVRQIKDSLLISAES